MQIPLVELEDKAFRFLFVDSTMGRKLSPFLLWAPIAKKTVLTFTIVDDLQHYYLPEIFCPFFMRQEGRKLYFFSFLLCFLSNITHSLVLGSLAKTLRFEFLLMVIIVIQDIRDETPCLVVNTTSWPFREACYPNSHGVTSVTTIQPAIHKICMAVFGISVLNCILEIQIAHSQL